MELNKLNNAWVEAGNVVNDLQAKANAMVVDDDATAEDVKNITNQIENAKAKRDLAKKNLEEAQDAAAVEVIKAEEKPLTADESKKSDKFLNDFVGLVKGNPRVVNEANSSTDENGNAIGLTIPQDIQVMIHQLVRQYDSLEQYVNVENVTTLSGSRVYEKWTDVTALHNLDSEDDSIGDNDDPKLTTVKYLIKRYAGITTVTNSLLKDTADNILAWLTSWIAKKVVVTRNQAILDVLPKAPNKANIKKFDDLKDILNTKIDPAVAATSTIITNQSGLNALSKVKTTTGKYIMQHDPTQPDIPMVEGKRVIVVSDRWMPKTNGGNPMVIGNLAMAVTLFNRENTSLLATNIGAGAFEKDQTKIRVIDRFDVEPTDLDAIYVGTIADAIDNNDGSNGSSASAGK